ncbi:hypothetical protein DIPPA_06997 [Diplonema papillatum]|nr:hypothetical protein DIPPA_06997 [Diplonema papillatum]
MDDLSFDQLLQKCNLSFEKIRSSSKRAEVLEALAKRAGIETDVVQVAMWETQWEEKETEAAAKPAVGGPPPAAEIAFTDPVKGSHLKITAAPQGAQGLCYSVNGQMRPPFRSLKVVFPSSVQPKGPRIEFSELRTAATVPWDASKDVLLRLRALADSKGVVHNIPADGVVRGEKKQHSPAPQQHQQHQQHQHQHQPQPLQQLQHPVSPTVASSPPQTMVAVEGELLNVPIGTIGVLLAATYGDSRSAFNCLPGVAARVHAGGLSLAVSHESLGIADPSPNAPKKLEITFTPAAPCLRPILPAVQPLLSPGSFSSSPSGTSASPSQFQPGVALHAQGGYTGGPLSPHDGRGGQVLVQSGSVGLNHSFSSPYHASSMPALGEQDDEDTLTERSGTSYRHDPYTASAADDVSERSIDDTYSKKHSETQEELARYANQPPNRANRASVTTPAGEWLSVAPGTMARVVRAVYGAGNYWVLATKAVKPLLVNGGIAGLFVSEEALDVQDPCPDLPKALVVTYRPCEVGAVPLTPGATLQAFPPPSPTSATSTPHLCSHYSPRGSLQEQL